MTSHLGVMILLAACLAVVFGVLLRDDGAQQWRLAVRIFVALAGGAYLLGWVMYFTFG
jgi:hypothetical protein